MPNQRRIKLFGDNGWAGADGPPPPSTTKFYEKLYEDNYTLLKNGGASAFWDAYRILHSQSPPFEVPTISLPVGITPYKLVDVRNPYPSVNYSIRNLERRMKRQANQTMPPGTFNSKNINSSRRDEKSPCDEELRVKLSQLILSATIMNIMAGSPIVGTGVWNLPGIIKELMKLKSATQGNDSVEFMECLKNLTELENESSEKFETPSPPLPMNSGNDDSILSLKLHGASSKEKALDLAFAPSNAASQMNCLINDIVHLRMRIQAHTGRLMTNC